jgi:hypothetical protein
MVIYLTYLKAFLSATVIHVLFPIVCKITIFVGMIRYSTHISSVELFDE